MGVIAGGWVRGVSLRVSLRRSARRVRARRTTRRTMHDALVCARRAARRAPRASQCPAPHAARLTARRAARPPGIAGRGAGCTPLTVGGGCSIMPTMIGLSVATIGPQRPPRGGLLTLNKLALMWSTMESMLSSKNGMMSACTVSRWCFAVLFAFAATVAGDKSRLSILQPSFLCTVRPRLFRQDEPRPRYFAQWGLFARVARSSPSEFPRSTRFCSLLNSEVSA